MDPLETKLFPITSSVTFTDIPISTGPPKTRQDEPLYRELLTNGSPMSYLADSNLECDVLFSLLQVSGQLYRVRLQQKRCVLAWACLSHDKILHRWAIHCLFLYSSWSLAKFVSTRCLWDIFFLCLKKTKQILTVRLLTFQLVSSPGEPYSQSLAKGLILIFFFITASILGTPWRQIRQAWA